MLNENDKAHYHHIQDIDEVRPRMAPAPKVEGMMASKGSSYWNLYLQDLASDVMVDKYGYDKGIANWEWSIGQSSGVMFAAASKICNEKYTMLKELGYIGQKDNKWYGDDYFKRSYFDIWKEWKEFKKTGKRGDEPAQPASKQTTTKSAAAAASKPAPKAATGKYPTVLVTDKDTQRIQDIVQKSGGDKNKMMQLAQRMANTISNLDKAVARARAAEEDNYHDLAKVFFDRADTLMNETAEETAELDRLFEMFESIFA